MATDATTGTTQIPFSSHRFMYFEGFPAPVVTTLTPSSTTVRRPHRQTAHQHDVNAKRHVGQTAGNFNLLSQIVCGGIHGRNYAQSAAV
jgi:hypothetical protein